MNKKIQSKKKMKNDIRNVNLKVGIKQFIANDSWKNLLSKRYK